MKKKIVTLCLVAALAVTAIGGTLAYFTDTDKETNTMEFGNVGIDLIENFDSETPFVPAVVENDVINNTITKETTVKNDGENEAYVRILYMFEGTYAEVEDYIGYFVADDKDNWDFSMVHESYDVNGKLINARGITDGDGNVWTLAEAVYTIPLEAGVTTPKNLSKIFLAPTATAAGVEEHFGSEYQIHVLAQGTQVDGFSSARTALNASFGNVQAANGDADFVSDNTLLGWFGLTLQP